MHQSLDITKGLVLRTKGAELLHFGYRVRTWSRKVECQGPQQGQNWMSCWVPFTSNPSMIHSSLSWDIYCFSFFKYHLPVAYYPRSRCPFFEHPSSPALMFLQKFPLSACASFLLNPSLTTSDEPGFRCCFWHLTSLLTAIFLQSHHTHYRLFFFLAMHTKPARSLTRSHLWVPSKELANPWFHLLSSSRLPVRCTWGLKCSISIGAAADGELCAIPEPDSNGKAAGRAWLPVAAVLLGPAVRPVQSVLGGLLMGQCHLPPMNHLQRPLCSALQCIL